MHNYHSVNMEQIELQNTYGGKIAFRGRIFSECSYYDEESKTLTRQRLYVTDNGEQVYSIVSGSGASKEHRVYLLRVDGDECVINNGSCEIAVRKELLMASMRTLCGFNEGCSADLLKSLEETLDAANA